MLWVRNASLLFSSLAFLRTTSFGAILAFTLTLPGLSEAHDKDDDDSVRPILECVTAAGNGSYTALFGYNNEKKFTVTIPVGWKNKFSPSPINRGQTTVFKPGRIVGAFRVPYGA